VRVRTTGAARCAVSRSGTGPQTQYNHLLIKERDLSDEWGIVPLTSEALEQAESKAYDSDIMRISSYDEMVALVNEDVGAA
jgi:hypothetical protein